MTTPTTDWCRPCQLDKQHADLTDEERQAIPSEPINAPGLLCPKHKKQRDQATAAAASRPALRRI